jgi:acetyltransferase-like isoleucine patch superfamily enzyme
MSGVTRRARLTLRKNRWIYDTIRGARMWYRRKRWGLSHVHATSYIQPGSQISPDLVAHEYTFINTGCMIWPRVQIGAYTMLGPRVAIIGGDHLFDKPGMPIIFSGRPDMPTTIIERDCWLGYACVIRAGVRIGRGAIIGANAVITRDVGAYEIWGGVPGRKIGERFPVAADRAKHDEMLRRPPPTIKERGEFPDTLRLADE